MDRSLRAALLSALVFPGAGQLYLGRRARGCLFMLPALAAAGYVLAQVFERTSALLDDINSGRLAFDPVLIAARLEQQGQDGAPLTTVAVAVMLACWAVSALDAYRTGRAAPRAAQEMP